MEHTITCINCPIGCRMTVVISSEGNPISVSGNTCPRGAAYAKQECTAPERMITAVISVAGTSVPLSVKTSRPVPKNMIRNIMEALSHVSLSVPIHAGDIIQHNILDTGADIVATRSLI